MPDTQTVLCSVNTALTITVSTAGQHNQSIFQSHVAWDELSWTSSLPSYGKTPGPHRNLQLSASNGFWCAALYLYVFLVLDMELWKPYGLPAVIGSMRPDLLSIQNSAL